MAGNTLWLHLTRLLGRSPAAPSRHCRAWTSPALLPPVLGLSTACQYTRALVLGEGGYVQGVMLVCDGGDPHDSWTWVLGESAVVGL